VISLCISLLYLRSHFVTKINPDQRTSSNIYVLSEIGDEKCFLAKEYKVWLWNIRMGHINFDNLIKVRKNKEVREMHQIMKPTDTLCKHCHRGKKTKTKIKSKEYSTTGPLEIVHMNLVGPTRTKGLKGEKQFMLLVDDYTRIIVFFFLGISQKHLKTSRYRRKWLKMKWIKK
jgi:hypothetical protein